MKPSRERFCSGRTMPITFLPLKYSNAPNNTPFQATFTQPDLGLDPIETELQLSFKIKGMEGVFGHDNVDLWFGYTSLLSGRLTTPVFLRRFGKPTTSRRRCWCFARIMRWVISVDVLSTWGWCISRMAVSEGLSRSWNRVYTQFGFERDNLALLIRPWVRHSRKSRR